MAEPFVNDTETWEIEGKRLSDRIWDNKAALRESIDSIIRDGIAQGETVAEVSAKLLRYVRPSFSRLGEGKARYAAVRLATHETNRALAIGTQQTALADPAGSHLKYEVSPTHADHDACDALASHDEGFGRGVYPAKDAPLPPQHILCACRVSVVPATKRNMDQFVEHLRVEYGLADPPDLSPDELAVFRAETAAIREGVQVMFRAWFEQTGLVSRESLLETSPTVKDWVSSVNEAKQKRRAA